MNKIWIALAAAAAGFIVPVVAQAREEGAWDSTRAHVQAVERNDDVAVGRDEGRWDSTRSHVADHKTDTYAAAPGATEQWDSTRRVPLQQQRRVSSGEAQQTAGGADPLICACRTIDDVIA